MNSSSMQVFYLFKFDRLIPIATFKEPYSRILNGTQAPCKFIYLFIFKFDRPRPIAVFREPYSGILNRTRAPRIRVPCKFFFFFFLITLYSIFYKSSFTLKLDFEKIKFRNKGISLISLEKGAKC